jgi:threonine aldolase
MIHDAAADTVQTAIHTLRDGAAGVRATPGIDLRSDTVTVPSAAMRRAIAMAEVGDDVYGEDPTVNALEARVAALLGKEAALFVTSGTQCNITAILSHCQRGDEIILGDQAHIFLSEAGAASTFAGVQTRTVPTRPDGTLDAATVAAAVRSANIHNPRTALICLENTHNRCGGAVLSREQLHEIRAVADRAQLPIHLDGARLFNAAVALGVPAAHLAAEADTVGICLSKGLGAPVGSVLCGPVELMQRARKWRKMLGGGMRQAGILAAAGLFALEHMVERLADDHANARVLAEGLSTVRGLAVDAAAVRTNIVMAEVDDPTLSAAVLVARFREAGVLAGAAGPARIRFVTHFGVERGDVEQAVEIVRRVMKN